MWNIFDFINDSMESTKITHFSNYKFISKQNEVSQLLAPLFSVLCAPSPCKDNGTESFSIMFNEIGEHIGRDLRPFLHTESFQILDILRSALMDCPLQLKPQVFNGVQVRRRRWPLQNVDFVVN